MCILVCVTMFSIATHFVWCHDRKWSFNDFYFSQIWHDLQCRYTFEQFSPSKPEIQSGFRSYQVDNLFFLGNNSQVVNLVDRKPSWTQTTLAITLSSRWLRVFPSNCCRNKTSKLVSGTGKHLQPLSGRRTQNKTKQSNIKTQKPNGGRNEFSTIKWGVNNKHTLVGDSHKIFNGGEIMQKKKEKKQFVRNGKLNLERLPIHDFLN